MSVTSSMRAVMHHISRSRLTQARSYYPFFKESARLAYLIVTHPNNPNEGYTFKHGYAVQMPQNHSIGQGGDEASSSSNE
ncbi:hypothetical protein Bca4012_038507 [Brassica carinata]